MTSSIYLIDRAGVNIHLAGTRTPWNGSGTPWTAQNTSPFEISMNDATGGVWTPTAPEPLPVYTGGPPFRLGSDLAYQGYGNIMETVGIQAYATSHDNAVGLLRLLRRALGGAATLANPILAVQPSGSSQVVYYEILSARLQELPTFINQEAALGTKVVRALVTWTLSPFGGRLGGGETLLNNVSMVNTGTGSPNNMAAYGSSGAGDMVHDGQPMNVRVGSSAAPSTIGMLYLASAHARTYSTAITGAFSSTGSNIAGVGLGQAIDISAATLRPGLRLRTVVRLASASASAQLRVRYGATLGATYEGPWVDVIGTGTQLLDLGGAPMGLLARQLSVASYAPRNYVFIELRGSTGGGSSINVTYVEYVLYYTWCTVDMAQIFSAAGISSAGELGQIDAYTEVSGRPALPRPTPIFVLTAVTVPPTAAGILPVRGTPPRYFPEASLYLGANYIASIGNRHATTLGLQVTASHAPLYQTLRGGG